jgi:CRISPR system Cascade subunit CasA
LNLLSSPWIPVRQHGGAGSFQLLTYRQLLCEDTDWRISLPRDDMEMACLQLLVSLTQVLFLPVTLDEVEERLMAPMVASDFDDAIAPCADWFDLDHPTQPFMQTRDVVAKEITPIQKLMIGLPEGHNHCFFDPVGEVKQLSAPVAAIALFNQATNCPSFGGGFKGSLRGGAPITTLVDAKDLRRQVWSNVIYEGQLKLELPPSWQHDLSEDRPTWIDPIQAKQVIYATQIGLARGLFWQPAHVELIQSEHVGRCDVLGIETDQLYTGFRKEKFNFTLQGFWPHPHGARTLKFKKGEPETKYQSFTSTAPGWTRLSELVVTKAVDKGEGNVPALPILQAAALEIEPLTLIIGGYRNKQASVVERRHELMTLGRGWSSKTEQIDLVVRLGLAAKDALRHKLYFAVKGHRDKSLEGLSVPIHLVAEQRFYARTETLILSAIADEQTFDDWVASRSALVDALTDHCKTLFEELTDPYAAKPELIPIIAWARRSLNNELKKLKEGQ